MKKYTVVFHADAETDVASSYLWGCKVWGEERARTWIRELRRIVISRLTSSPLACPLAPESEDLGVPIRHLIMDRYRILFTTEKRTVTILHVRGPYVTRFETSEADDE